MEALIEVLTGKRVCVLTGAGISTESGIPDYRGPTAPPRKRAPIQHREFIDDALIRARYWARSMLGWPRFREFAPNAAHRALTSWPQVTGLITQNVDRLHQKAGHPDVLELHGALAEVRCLSCGSIVNRDELQQRLVELNPHALKWSYTLFADGDAMPLADEATQILCRRLHRNAGQRDFCRTTIVARRERESKHARRGFRVLVEHFVKVTHPEKQDGVLMVRLDLPVLLHERRCRTTHFPDSVTNPD